MFLKSSTRYFRQEVITVENPVTHVIWFGGSGNDWPGSVRHFNVGHKYKFIPDEWLFLCNFYSTTSWYESNRMTHTYHYIYICSSIRRNSLEKLICLLTLSFDLHWTENIFIDLSTHALLRKPTFSLCSSHWSLWVRLNSRKALCADIFEAQFFERDAASQSGSIVEGSHEGML